MTTPLVPKRGRPPLDQFTKSIQLHVRVTASQLQEAKAFAKRNRETIPDIIRRGLRRELSK